MYIEVKFRQRNPIEGPAVFEMEDSSTVQKLMENLEPLVALPTSVFQIRSINQTLERSVHLSDILRRKDVQETAGSLNCELTVVAGEQAVASLRFYEHGECDRRGLLTLPAEALLVLRAPSPGFSSPSSDSFRDSVARVSPALAGLDQAHLMPSGFGFEVRNLAGSSASEAHSTADEDSDQVEAMEVDDAESDGSSGSDRRCTVERRDCCAWHKCGKPDTRPPYARTLPENRRYGVVISNADCCAETDSLAVMNHISELSERCVTRHLKFSKCTALARFDQYLLLITRNEKTAEWVLGAVESVCPPHTGHTFIDFFKLEYCTFINPIVEERKPLCAMFELMEAQNVGLSTAKWTVTGRTPLDPCCDEYDTVTGCCENELIELYIDADSRKLLENQCSKVIYFMFHLKFTFDC
ncbi:uncharacterized protein [Drosophila takahashii]|uniref:uncharacterized protein n=1 Tax=Drosophila takahashii TaxID=29030 RepID=UPI003898F7E1